MAARFRSFLARHHFSLAPLQAEWVRELNVAPVEHLLDDIRMINPDLSNVAGAEVYRQVLRRIFWLKPLYFLSILPIARQLFDFAYRWVNKNRYRISKSCGIRAG